MDAIGVQDNGIAVRNTALSAAMKRSPRIRAIKRRFIPPRTGRQRVPTALGIDGLFTALRSEEASFVVLRWFEDLPDVEVGEDLDMLVADNDTGTLDALLTRDPDRGTVKVDAYSVSGRRHSWNGTAYYPPELAARILERSLEHPSGARVPCPEDHFASLAFHALYHKGYVSGLPVSGTEGPRHPGPDHDYRATLVRLADSCSIAVDITMADLDAHLASVGWRPPLDTLGKWAPHNAWVAELQASLVDEAGAPPGLAVFVVREQAGEAGAVEEIGRLLRAHGFDILAVRRIAPDRAEACQREVRGGNWGKGPYPTSGGPPHTVVVAVDLAPLTPSPEQQRAHPGLDNGRLPVVKVEVRDWWNGQAAERCNILHTSDSAGHAVHYLQLLLPDEVDHLTAEAASRR